MKNLLYYSLLLALIIGSFSCYKDKDTDGQLSDEFYLRHDGADLPIWVRGNDTSETFIIFLHGGPFLSGIINDVYGHFAPLHEDYAMVYFDQRGGGFSHGCRAVELTEEQFIEDLEVLVDLIQHKYPQAQNLFLMGHSWGGFLGTAFLKTGNNQQDFKGWIELSGSHNFPMGWASSRTFSMNYAQNKIAENSPDKSVWEQRLQELEDTPVVTDYETLRVVNYVAQVIDREVNENSLHENPSFIYLLTSPVGAGFQQKNNFRVEELLVNRNLNPEMNLITLPSLLIYGEKDAIVTADIGQNGYDYLGTDPDDKYLVFLEESGHDIWSIEPAKFFETVQTFVETYK